MRLLHFADTHIGIESYGRIDPGTGRHTRLTDFETSLQQVIDAALAAEVDAALFAGDAYRTCYPNPTHQQVFAAAIGRLAEAGIPVVMVAGNHDLPVAFGRATSLDIFGTLAAERVQVLVKPALVRLETRAGPLQVACLPWPTASLLRAGDAVEDEETIRQKLIEAVARKIDQLAEQLDPATPAVMLAHLCAQDAIFSGSEKIALTGGDPTIARGTLADPRFDYVALGHIHRHQDLNPESRPPVVYPGSLDRIDFGERSDQKSVCLVTIEPGPTPASRVTGYECVPLRTRPFVALEIEVPAEADINAWLRGRLEPLELDEAVFRLRYRCTDAQQADLDLPMVRQLLAASHCVAGLIRERTEESRRPRVEVTEHHSVADALSRYLDSRAELAPHREAIVAAATELSRRLDEREATGKELDE